MIRAVVLDFLERASSVRYCMTPRELEVLVIAACHEPQARRSGHRRVFGIALPSCPGPGQHYVDRSYTHVQCA